MNHKQKHSHRPPLPPWMRVPFTGGPARGELKRLLHDLKLNTVCESANCPNLCECWRRKTATFMLLGDTCTRNCRFCGIKSGTPIGPDPEEPNNVATAVEKLGLEFVVLTCVTRDDLPDGGAGHLAKTVQCVHSRLPDTGIEVLCSDFKGKIDALETLLASRPAVLNHNVETCERLTGEIRSEASYARSLKILSAASEISRKKYDDMTAVKSGFMLGLGESEKEIRDILGDLSSAGVRIVTIGQYLPPSSNHWPLDRYVKPEEFDKWSDTARREFGFAHVFSGPLVRSSYMADKAVGL